jgi:hypothetical protein
MYTMPPRAGWTGTIFDFLNGDHNGWAKSLESWHQASLGEVPSQSSRAAWQNCYQVLKDQLGELASKRPDVSRWGMTFEYELPRERGRRVDVAVLAGDSVLVLEFKDFAHTLKAHIDQVAAYVRDLSGYHAATHNRRVIPILVNTRSDAAAAEIAGVWVVGARNLGTLIDGTGVSGTPWMPMTDWIQSSYLPLPSLVRAARMIFKHEPLPRIKQAKSSGVENAVETVAAIIKSARSKSERHLVFVTGVPGAGKTLTGLQLVYTLILDDQGQHVSGVFLSGNGPLVSVLQYALKGSRSGRREAQDSSRVFVRDVLAFVRDHISPESPLPPEHVWVYDEAQRAWDADMVAEKHRYQMSEPEMFLKLGERMPDWSVMVGLIGSGQEIFRGEERGLEQWNDALKRTASSWNVHCPSLDAQNRPLAELFTESASITVNETLGLDHSLRSHLAIDLPNWVNALLAGDISSAASEAPKIRSQNFNLYVTGDVEVAKEYVRYRYTGYEEARYGLLASNKDRCLPDFNVRNDYPVQKNLKNRIGSFFVDPPNSKFSCCQLRDVATPFECQGLEFDFSIVCWGDDLWWDGRKWATRDARKSREMDPYRLRINGYRVLLTRGRDGMIIFVPPVEKLHETRRILLEAGCQELS